MVWNPIGIVASADKRGNGEWFTLSAEDIEEFKAQDEMEVPR
ncbi:MAG TPA: hypothetical protein V6C90_08970 [Coleofasciculaceae cyanobacterium]|jgi:hypothetical protein